MKDDNAMDVVVSGNGVLNSPYGLMTIFIDEKNSDMKKEFKNGHVVSKFMLEGVSCFHRVPAHWIKKKGESND